MQTSQSPPGFQERAHDVVVIGGSSGSIEALSLLLAKVPVDIPATLLVVIHTSETGPYLLPELLQRRTALRFATVEDNKEISYGQIYIARPNLHLLLENGHIRVVFGPRENRLRPAIDPLFRSAAVAHQARVIGILLSGGLEDGVAGLRDIQSCGGVTIVQDPDSALFPELIHNALNEMAIDYVAPPEKIAEILKQLAGTAADTAGAHASEQNRAQLKNAVETEGVDHAAKLPDREDLSGYRRPGCSSASLFQACWKTSERHLYGALQVLEENAQVGSRSIRKAEEARHPASPELIDQVRRLENEAAIVRNLLYDRTQLNGCTR